MQAIILDALRQTTEEHDIGKVLSALLTNRGWEQETFFLRQMEITPCSSCGRCAMDTPGLCFIKDGMEEIYSRWANCQLLILYSHKLWGYHSSLKMVLDRIMPMNTPYFALRKENSTTQTDTIHAFAAGNRPTLRRQRPDRDRERNTFEYLIERNAVNMNIDRFASAVFLPEHTAAQVLTRLEQALKEVL